ncbi:hypothetical protein [Spirosoma litoris]
MEAKDDQANKGNTFIGDLRSIYGNWGNTLRAVFLLTGIAIIVVLSMKYLWPGELQVEINKSGTIVVRGQGQHGNTEVAILSLPSTICWHNTGVVLQPKQKAVITATGEINLAINKVVTAADSDFIPLTNWTSPVGESFKVVRSTAPSRGRLLLHKSHPNLRIGNLLACVVPTDENNKPSKYNPRPEGVYIFDWAERGEREIVNFHEKEAYIYLTVNDLVLDEKSQDAYMGEMPKTLPRNATPIQKKEFADSRRYLQRWREINSSEYWDLFYKDNIGNFLVQIQKSPE